jgi:competence protein ComEC
MAIISCGEGNSYGHPHDVILDRLEKAGIPFLRTDKEGTIIFVSDKNEVNRLTKK